MRGWEGGGGSPLFLAPRTTAARKSFVYSRGRIERALRLGRGLARARRSFGLAGGGARGRPPLPVAASTTLRNGHF